VIDLDSLDDDALAELLVRADLLLRDRFQNERAIREAKQAEAKERGVEPVETEL
jgi:hypothetical protein